MKRILPRTLVKHVSGDACKDISREDMLRMELAVNMGDTVTSAEDMGWNKTQMSPRSPAPLCFLIHLYASKQPSIPTTTATAKSHSAPSLPLYCQAKETHPFRSL